MEDLRYGQGGIYAQLNYDTLSPGYASKEGIFAPSARKVRERAKMVREWLRERPEDEIVGQSRFQAQLHVTNLTVSGVARELTA